MISNSPIRDGQKRNHMKNIMLLMALSGLLNTACQSSELSLEKVVKSEAEWRSQLTEDEYAVLRLKGTERAFTGDYHELKTDGVFACKACQLPVFSSKSKFDSGTGWPSFTIPILNKYVLQLPDTSHGMMRTEIVCARCDSHLGHVFQDGPEPTGLRYCINSLSLSFQAD